MTQFAIVGFVFAPHNVMAHLMHDVRNNGLDRGLVEQLETIVLETSRHYNHHSKTTKATVTAIANLIGA